MTSTNPRTRGLSLLASLVLLLASGCASEAEGGDCASGDCDAMRDDAGAGRPGEDALAERDGGAPPEDEACDGDACGSLTAAEREDMLSALGVDLNPDAPTDPNGEPLSENHNPLGARNTSLFEIDELFFAGMTVPAVGAQGRLGLVDDEQAGGELLFDGADDAWTRSPTRALAIDLDGDGIEEIVSVDLTNADATAETLLRARVLRRERDAFAISEPIPLASFAGSPLGTSGFWNGYCQLDVAAADLDGDGSEDLFVSVAGQLLQFRHDGSTFTRVGERTFDVPGAGDAAEVYVRLAAGDLELNGRDQLVIVASAYFPTPLSLAQFHIVADELSGDLRSGTVQKLEGLRQLTTASPAIADLDGDGVPEVVFAGRSTGAVNGLVVLVMNGSKHAEPYSFKATHFQDELQRTALYPLAVADLSGSRRDQILAGSTILRLDASGELAVVRNGLRVLPNTLVAASGDYTGDHRDDLLFLRGIGKGNDPLGYDLEGYSIVHVDSSETLQITDFAGDAAITDYPTLTFANVDEDSPIVQFRGRELTFGDPTVLAVIAAPPTFDRGGQSEGATAFGRSDETEEEETESMALSLGIGFGYDGSVPFIGGVEVEASVMGSLGWTTSHTRTIERTISFATGPDDDKVVFTTVPYDTYRYEVVSSPEPDAVGSTIVVAVPREPQTLSVSRAYYNEQVRGDVAPIDDRVFSHEIGTPFSYPTRAERDARIAAGDALYSELATVGVGTGSTTVTVSRSEGIGAGESRDLEYSLEFKTNVGGVTVIVTQGGSYQTEMTVTNTTGTFYEGTVGDIPEDRIDELGLYRFGLFAYPQSLGGRELLVVNYWVEE